MRRAAAAVVCLAALALVPAGPAAAGTPDEPPAKCASTHGVPGGEWRTFGHDYANTRTQDREHVISVADVPLLSPAWTFSTTEAGGEGDITATPIVADGCVYVATTRGWLFALNADTGEMVWRKQVPYGGLVTGSAGLARGRVLYGVSRTQPSADCPGDAESCVGPYAVAVDQDSGRIDWATRPLDRQPGSDIFGSPVIYRGMVMLGVSGGAAELGDEADRYAFQGSMSFIDARSGRVVKKTWTIHRPGKPNDDFAGAGIWSTPAIDRGRGVAYVGSANPFRPQAEHEHANSVLKFDVDPSSRHFGEIIDSYKGLVDEYFPALSKLPCFDIPGNPPPYYPQGAGSCGDIDLDFGAAPNLFTDASGRQLVGAGQKSGVYHVFDARTMEPVWKQIVGTGGPLGGIVGATAYDGHAFYGPITLGGYLWSLGAAHGAARWLAPVADVAHYGPPVAVANGVVYTVDLTGFLDAFDARTGLPLTKRPLILGGGGPLPLSWGGVSVARNTIYAATGIRGLPEGFVIAFKRGGTGDLVEDVEGTLGELTGGGGEGGGLPAGATVVAGPGAASTTYLTPVMITQVGGPLSFTNLDVAQHDVTSVQKRPGGGPLFSSRLIGLGQTAPVEGLEDVQAGQSYAFYCSIHPGMKGTLIVR